MDGRSWAVFGRVLLGVLFSLSLAVPVQAQPTYQIDATVFPFKPEELQLEAANRKQLATKLANWARALSSGGDENRELVARALVVALGLDSHNRAAVIAKARFRRGDKMSEPGETVDSNELAKLLIQNAKLMKELGKEPDQQMAAYLVELAYDAAPGNDEIIYETELIRAELKMPVPWGKLTGDSSSVATTVAMPKDEEIRGAPEGDATAEGETATATPKAEPGPATDQSQINGLVVMALDGDMIGGKVMEINATLQPRVGSATEAEFATRVSKDMQISMDEAQRLALNRTPEAARDRYIRLSFDDKYSNKAGGSAGTAFCVVILSLLQDFDLDSKVAMTGDITVDGKVKKIGGVVSKVLGAEREGCKYVGIPQSNLEDFESLLVMGQVHELGKIQVFSMETIDEAVDLAKAERSENLQAAMDKFSSLQEQMKEKHWTGVVHKDENKALLEEVLKLAPNHQSARYLLNASKGKVPRTLTLTASLDGMFYSMSPLLAAIIKGDIGRYKISNRDMRTMERNLKLFGGKAHPKTKKIYYDFLNLIQQVEGFQTSFFTQTEMGGAGASSGWAEKQRRLLENIVNSWQQIAESYRELDYEGELKKELLKD